MNESANDTTNSSSFYHQSISIHNHNVTSSHTLHHRNSNLHERTRTKSNASSLKSTLSGIFSSNALHKHHKIQFSSSMEDYEIIKEIGGVDDISYLYLARHLPTNDLVSLKYTDMSLSPDIEYILELTRSVHNSKQIQNKFILPTLNSFSYGESLWIVTPTITYPSCGQLLKQHFVHGFDESLTLIILKDVLQALSYLHENNIIHNDIRAENILFNEKGYVQLTGTRQMLSLIFNGKINHSIFSLVGENLEWAAPEVVCQNSKYDCKADIYSLGITAIELAFAKTPFENWPPLKILLCKMQYPCPGISGMKEKKLSEQFWKFVMKCLKKDPRERPTVKDLLEDPIFKHTKSRSYLKNQLRHVALHQNVDES